MIPEGIPVVDFTEYLPKYAHKVEKEKFHEISREGQIPLDDFVKSFIQEFNKLSPSNLFSPQHDKIKGIVDLIRSNVSIITCTGIALNWPPIIPKPIEKIEEVSHLLLQLLKQVDHPNNFIWWLTRTIFPRLWSQKFCKYNNYCVAASLSKYQNYEKCWVILDNNFKLTIFVINDDKIKQIAREYITTVQGDTKTGNVSCYDNMNIEICQFKPYNSEQVEFWNNIIAKGKSHTVEFPFYLSSNGVPYPKPLKLALYYSTITPDVSILRALICPGKPCKKQDEALEAFYTMFTYSGNYPLLLKSIVANEFDDPDVDPQDPIDSESALGYLTRKVVGKTGNVYFKHVTSKILKYIDSKGKINWNSPDDGEKKKIEQIVSTIFKCIANSAPYISPHMSHLANVVRYFCAVRFNDKAILMRYLSRVYFGYMLIPSLENPQDFGSNFTIDNQDSVKMIVKIIQTVAQFQRMKDKLPEFSFLDERIEFHIMPKLEEFLFLMSDMPNNARYSLPDIEDLDKAIDTILDCIAINFSRFSNNIKIIFDDNNLKVSSIAGWSLSSALINVFAQKNDAEQIQKNNEATKSRHINNNNFSFDNIQSFDEIATFRPDALHASRSTESLDNLINQANAMDNTPKQEENNNNNGYEEYQPPPDDDDAQQAPTLPPAPELDIKIKEPEEEKLASIDELLAAPKKPKKGRKGKRAATVEVEAKASDSTPAVKTTGRKGRRGKKRANTVEPEQKETTIDEVAPKKGKKTLKKRRLSVEQSPKPKRTGRRGQGNKTVDEPEKPITKRNQRSKSVEAPMSIDELMLQTPTTKRLKTRRKTQDMGPATIDQLMTSPKTTVRKRRQALKTVDPSMNIQPSTTVPQKKTMKKGVINRAPSAEKTSNIKSRRSTSVEKTSATATPNTKTSATKTRRRTATTIDASPANPSTAVPQKKTMKKKVQPSLEDMIPPAPKTTRRRRGGQTVDGTAATTTKPVTEIPVKKTMKKKKLNAGAPMTLDFSNLNQESNVKLNTRGAGGTKPRKGSM